MLSSPFSFRTKTSILSLTVLIQVFGHQFQNLKRNQFRIENDKKLILFGAFGGHLDPRKGFDLLVAALGRISQLENIDQLRLMTFGSTKHTIISELGIQFKSLGHLSDDISLKVAYSCRCVCRSLTDG